MIKIDDYVFLIGLIEYYNWRWLFEVLYKGYVFVNIFKERLFEIYKIIFEE